ncbi:sigma factor-like helix-turn-helix DNA-binding protein [Actinosynnema sp. NPDC023658]|uniref:sigma factor-like helix-turn-helix DNA-binding protein n=1 Tax=Actinosynnema sp. NPDC023658 TaxID=3155465 RepID=UPI0033EFFB1F
MNSLFREPRGLGGRLLTVAGEVVDGWRRKGSAPRRAPLTRPDGSGAVRGPEPRPSVALVDELIGRLGEEHRAAICETYVRGRTVREAAHVLGIPEAAVKSRVYDAMEILRAALRERN